MKKIILLLMLCLCFTISFSQRTITGNVTDDAGKGIMGATVYFPSLFTGTETDAAGRFTILVPGILRLTMQVSHIGFTTRLMQVTDESVIEVKLTASLHDVQEIIITSPEAKLPENHPYSIQVYSREKLDQTSGLTLMSQLAYQPSIDRISTGTGIGKPVIRGNSFNRIVLQAMGTRIENQQWDDRHDLGVAESGIERVEVINGPAALMYGADALGGALIFVDEKPALQGKTEGDVTLGYNLNNNGTKFDIGYKQTSKKGIYYILRAATSLNGSYQQGGPAPENSKAGKYAANSKFLDASGKASIGLIKSWGTSRFSYTYYKQLTGIVELESDSVVEDEGEQKNYEVEAPYQDVTSNLVSLQNTFHLAHSRIYTDFAWQLNNRLEFEPLNNGIKKAKEKFIGLNLNVITYDIKWVSNASPKAGITIGSQGMLQENRNHGKTELVPDADVRDYAAYVTGRYDTEKINFLAGIRTDVRHIEIQKRIPDGETIYFPADNAEMEYVPVSGSAGLAWHPLSRLTVKLNAASGFSAPNYAELGTYGLHEGAYRFEIGNPDLDMEQNFEFDAGATFEKSDFSVHAEGFYNAISNYIYLENSGTYQDSLPVYLYLQNNAVIHGGNVGFDLHPVEWPFIALGSEFSFTRGIRSGLDLPFIPAPKIVSILTLKSAKKIMLREPFVNVTMCYYFAQHHVAPYELKTANYRLVDVMIGGNLKLGKKILRLRIYSTNIFDEDYYSHLSLVKNIGIRDMGRNTGFQLSMPF